MKKFCVIGLGKFGYMVAEHLAKNDFEVLAIDQDEYKVSAIRHTVAQSVCMELFDEVSLRTVGIKEIDTVIIALGRNFAHTVLITQLLKATFKIDTVIVRTAGKTERDVLIALGADQVIVPEHEAAIKLADNISSPFSSTIRLAPECSIVQVVVPYKFIGKVLQDLLIYETYGVDCIGIKRGERVLLMHEEKRIQKGDFLLCMGSDDDLGTLTKL
jgi:trk system potassium uptake protein